MAERALVLAPPFFSAREVYSMKKATVLIVDDDPRIRELLRLYMEQAGFAVMEAENGLAAILSFQQSRPDLIVLDIMMPVLDGLETCRQIKKIDSTPIILLTARAEDDDKLIGFETGADDYVSKPFAPGEVVARAQAILRRSLPTDMLPVSPPKTALSCCRLEIDANSRTVTRADEIIELTAKEFDLLYILAAHPGRIHTREALLAEVWGFDTAGDSRTVDVHVQRLRQKIQNGTCPSWNIATVWGVGYRFDFFENQEHVQ
jgi:two-component system, OmpR family, response regulator ResD